MMMRPGLGADFDNCAEYGDCGDYGGGGGTDWGPAIAQIGRSAADVFRASRPTYQSVGPYGTTTFYGSGVQTMTGNPLLQASLGQTTASLGVSPSMLLLLGVGLVVVMMAKRQ
jgi:hypothetical protein